MMPQPSPIKVERIIELKEILYSTQQIYKHTEKIRLAYEHLKSRYDILSIENDELRKPRSVRHHKRRKTDELENNDSENSRSRSDFLNEAIQDISSCIEDEVIESTPKPDISRKNVTKKFSTSKSPNTSNEPVNHIKVEKVDDLVGDSKEPATFIEPKIETKNSPESPLRSVENQTNVGKENRQKNAVKWISNSFLSPSRVSRSGFISTKSPKASRLSLSKTLKQTTLELPRKTKNATVSDLQTCAETYFDGTPPKKISDLKRKFFRQQCLETCISASKDTDDDNVFDFNSHLKPNKTDFISPQKIKLESLTGQVQPSNVNPKDKVIAEDSDSCSSSVLALSGEKSEIIVIEESQPLFDDCSDTFLEKVDLNIEPVIPVANMPAKSKEQIAVDNHVPSCRQCKMFMESNPHVNIEQRLVMVERCLKKYTKVPDTDPEYWNPRFNPTPESQKQETLIDDRWVDKKF